LPIGLTSPFFCGFERGFLRSVIPLFVRVGTVVAKVTFFFSFPREEDHLVKESIGRVFLFQQCSLPGAFVAEIGPT